MRMFSEETSLREDLVTEIYNIMDLFEDSSEALTFEQQKPYLIRLLQISKN